MRWEDTVEIAAPVDVVWNLTLDVEKWPSITPTMTRVVRLEDGPLRIGSRARVKQPRQSEAVWTVTHLEDRRQFTWQTPRWGLTIVGSHHVEPAGDHCRNTLTLDVTGPGSRLFGRVFGRMILSAIQTENAGFRTAAQRAANRAAP